MIIMYSHNFAVIFFNRLRSNNADSLNNKCSFGYVWSYIELLKCSIDNLLKKKTRLICEKITENLLLTIFVCPQRYIQIKLNIFKLDSVH